MHYCLLAEASLTGQNDVTITFELILSAVAIIISIVTACFEYFGSQRINRTNLEADFFKDIYGDYLMKKIPEARKVIHYNNNVVSDTDDLINVLNSIRQDSLFFKYKDKSYYDLLCKELQALEDKLVKKTGPMQDDDYVDFITEINQDIEEIYDIIMNKYVGKKNKSKKHI